jgi:hypothetical protein
MLWRSLKKLLSQVSKAYVIIFALLNTKWRRFTVWYGHNIFCMQLRLYVLFSPSRLVPKLKQGLYPPKQSSCSLKLITHLHLDLNLKMQEALPTPPAGILWYCSKARWKFIFFNRIKQKIIFHVSRKWHPIQSKLYHLNKNLITQKCRQYSFLYNRFIMQLDENYKKRIWNFCTLEGIFLLSLVNKHSYMYANNLFTFSFPFISHFLSFLTF